MADSMLAARVVRVLERQGIPIVSVSIGDATNKATWLVTYQPSATQLQRDAGAAAIAAYDPTLVDTAWENDKGDADLDNNKAFRALARATFELKSNAWTLVQYTDRIKAIYRSL